MGWLSDLGDTVGGWFGWDDAGQDISGWLGYDTDSKDSSGFDWGGLASGIGDMLGDIGSGVGDVFSSIIPGISSAFEGFTDFIGEAGSGLGDLIGSAGNGISGLLNNSAAAAAATAAATYKSTEDTNRTNVGISAANRDFSAAEALKNRNFQWDAMRAQQSYASSMANTEHQRAVNDLRSAGLNPMLAAMKGGNSAPQGGMASGSMAATPGNVTTQPALAQALSSAFGVARQKAEIDNMRIANENARKLGGKIDAETGLIGAQTANTEQQRLVGIGSAAKLDKEVANLVVEHERLNQYVQNLREERERIKGDAALREFDVKRMRPAELALVQSQARLSQYAQPGARNTAESNEGWYGKNVRPYVQDIFGGAKAGGSVGLKIR